MHLQHRCLHRPPMVSTVVSLACSNPKDAVELGSAFGSSCKGFATNKLTQLGRMSSCSHKCAVVILHKNIYNNTVLKIVT